MSTAPKLTEWRKGPPPSVGWWNASCARRCNVRRWWNGKRWSSSVLIGYTDDEAAFYKKRAADTSDVKAVIEWRGLAEEPKP